MDSKRSEDSRSSGVASAAAAASKGKGEEEDATTDFLAFEQRTLAKSNGTTSTSSKNDSSGVSAAEVKKDTGDLSDALTGVMPMPASDIVTNNSNTGNGNGNRPPSQPGAFQAGIITEEETEEDPEEPPETAAAAPTAATPVPEPNLSVARLVDDSPEETSLPIPTAQVYQRQESPRIKDNHKLYAGGTLITILVFAAIALLLVFLLAKDAHQEDTLPTPTLVRTNAPTLAPTNTMDALVLSLLPNSTQKHIEWHPKSPQHKAYQWVIQDPYLNTYQDYRIQQRFALAVFYYATSGQHWIHQNQWMNYSSHECSWFSRPYFEDVEMYMNSNILSTGFVLMYDSIHKPCSQNHTGGTFQHLWIFKNNLKGTLPWQELALLSDLKSLALFGNDLDINLSSELGLLTNLEAMEFSASDVHGTIPTEIGLLTNMKAILSSTNKLTGTIPTEIGLLTDMEYMMYSQNQLAGTIPSEIGNLTNLQWLYFFSNYITGSLPTTLAQLTNLSLLNGYGNHITGTIPTNFGRFTDIILLCLHQNDLTGTIPSELGLLTNMFHGFMLNDNYLSGTIPTELGAMSLLVGGIFGSGTYGFGLGYNQVVGTIPTELGQLSLVERIWLQSNHLSGDIPPELLENMEELIDLRLQDNDLSGIVPGLDGDGLFWEHNNGTLKHWNISGNSLLNGIVPSDSALCNLLVMDCSELLCGCDCNCSSTTT